MIHNQHSDHSHETDDLKIDRSFLSQIIHKRKFILMIFSLLIILIGVFTEVSIFLKASRQRTYFYVVWHPSELSANTIGWRRS